jgi:hypothetical protein
VKKYIKASKTLRGHRPVSQQSKTIRSVSALDLRTIPTENHPALPRRELRAERSLPADSTDPVIHPAAPNLPIPFDISGKFSTLRFPGTCILQKLNTIYFKIWIMESKVLTAVN